MRVRKNIIKTIGRSQTRQRNAESADRKTLIVVVGMPGAGKSLASTVAKESGIPVIVSGDIIRREARSLRLPATRTNLGRLMLKIRKEEGMGAVAKRLLPIIDESISLVVVYEGARNIEEIDLLRAHYTVQCVAIHASPNSRYRRLLRRKRGDRPKTLQQFLERDRRELRVGLGQVIALSDRMVENEGTKEQLKHNTKRVLNAIRQ